MDTVLLPTSWNMNLISFLGDAYSVLRGCEPAPLLKYHLMTYPLMSSLSLIPSRDHSCVSVSTLILLFSCMSPMNWNVKYSLLYFVLFTLPGPFFRFWRVHRFHPHTLSLHWSLHGGRTRGQGRVVDDWRGGHAAPVYSMLRTFQLHAVAVTATAISF